VVITAYSGGKIRFRGNATDFEAFCMLRERE
jgi:hypothetical protein